MADSQTPTTTTGTKNCSPTKVETKATLSLFTARKTMLVAYCITFAFVACTAFFVLNLSSYSSPWLKNFLRTSSYRSHFSLVFSRFYPNSSQINHNPLFFPQLPNGSSQVPWGREGFHEPNGSRLNHGKSGVSEIGVVNQTGIPPYSSSVSLSQYSNDTSQSSELQSSDKKEFSKNPLVNESLNANATRNPRSSESLSKEDNLGDNQFTLESETGKESRHGLDLEMNGTEKGVIDKDRRSRNAKLGPNNGDRLGSADDYLRKHKKKDSMELMSGCKIFDGKWVRDDSYPLYAPGSCPHIDEPFNCFLNGRPDRGYEKYRWQPNGCNIPRLNGKHMLELLRGKRLVFVGDSLNRNMWESLVCVLQNSMEDKNKVFEASGRQEFRSEGSYSFIFETYNCSVEYFRSPFLVQEGEMPDKNGWKKETLRLDVIEKSSDKYKNADVLIFNTGHWWTHEKTSKGEGYYQEGSTVYDHLNAKVAFRKALTTWGRWIDGNIDPKRTLVFFRGYSASHFRGGRWNSGGQCDGEIEPIKIEKYLKKYPSKMRIFESVMNGMTTRVFYLNVTRMTGFRKDAHPSIYRKQNLSSEERRSPLRFQDCSHWCLPGVPDTWNELLYAQLNMEYNQRKQKLLHQEQQQRRP